MAPAWRRPLRQLPAYAGRRRRGGLARRADVLRRDRPRRDPGCPSGGGGRPRARRGPDRPRPDGRDRVVPLGHRAMSVTEQPTLTDGVVWLTPFTDRDGPAIGDFNLDEEHRRWFDQPAPAEDRDARRASALGRWSPDVRIHADR